MQGEPDESRAVLDSILRPTHRCLHSDATVSGDSGVPLGAIFSPCAVPYGQVPQAETPLPRCKACGSTINWLCPPPHAGTWSCSLCSSPNAFPADPAVLRALSAPVVDYVVPPDAEVQAQGDGRTVVLVLDTTMDIVDTGGLKECARQAAEVLMPGWRLALVTFGGAISIHDLSSSSVAAADVLPYDMPLKAFEDRVRAKLSSYLVPAEECRETLLAHASSLRGSNHRGPVAMRPRCLGPALRFALLVASLGRQAWGGSGHVVCVLGGPGTLGPGQAPAEGADEVYGGLLAGDAQAGFLFREATGFYQELVAEAQRSGTAIDVMGGGSRAINVPLLAPVAQLTGGALVLHEDLGGLLARNVREALVRHAGVRGWLDVRTSANVGLSRVLGPSLPLPEGSRKRHGLSRAATAMASAEASHGWGLVLEPTAAKARAGDRAVVQATASWVLPGGWRVFRTATLGLDIVGELQVVEGSIDGAAASVLLGKLVAAAAIQAGWPHEEGLAAGNRVLDGAVKRLREVHGRPQRWKSGLLGFGRQAESWRVPRALEPFLHAVFHLKRGPLLGNIAGHADEHSQLHSAMVQAGLSVGSAMVVPQLWRMLPDGQWHLSAPVDLALLPTSVLVLDHGTHLFVWVGQQADAAPHAAMLHEAALRLADMLRTGRFPVPECKVAVQGQGDTRYVISRLVPAHRDPEDLHPVQWKPLRDAPLDLRRSLVRQVPPSDLPSFVEWCGRNGIVFEGDWDPETVAEALRG